VLKTPIPTSTKKNNRRRLSLKDEVEELIGSCEGSKVPGRLSYGSENKNANVPRATKKTVLALAFDETPQSASTGNRRASFSSSGRRWSVKSSTVPILAALIVAPAVLSAKD
jgi:hypothetical protein